MSSTEIAARGAVAPSKITPPPASYACTVNVTARFCVYATRADRRN